MKQQTKPPSPSIPETGNGICKQCGETYNRKEVARVYGKLSAVLAGGFCTPQCYTNNQMSMPDYSPSIPVKEGENENLQKLADLLESRGVRKYLNINNFGYSQIERDIVELFEPPALPVKEGEVLDITKGEFVIVRDAPLRIDTGKFENAIRDNNNTLSASNQLVCKVYALTQKECQDRTKAICTAVNNTYGKGFNPAAMPDIHACLLDFMDIIKGISSVPFGASFTVTIPASLFENASIALQKATPNK